MGWPIGKCLVRSGIPAAVICAGRIGVDIAKNGKGFLDAFAGNVGLFLIIWLAASGFLWVATRLMPKTAK